MADASPSLYGLLSRAKPTWSSDELGKAYEKLHKVNVTDTVSLAKALAAGSLNALLAQQGERRFKSSTLALLSSQVRRPYREQQFAEAYRNGETDWRLGIEKGVDYAGTSTSSASGSGLSKSLSVPGKLGGPDAHAGLAPQSEKRSRAMRQRMAKDLLHAGEFILQEPYSIPGADSVAAAETRKERLRRIQSEPTFKPVVRAAKNKTLETLEAAMSPTTGTERKTAAKSISSKATEATLPPKKQRKPAYEWVPSAQGGMRRDDDALEDLLRRADAELKKGTLGEKSVWDEEDEEEQAPSSTASETPADGYETRYQKWLVVRKEQLRQEEQVRSEKLAKMREKIPQVVSQQAFNVEQEGLEKSGSRSLSEDQMPFAGKEVIQESPCPPIPSFAASDAPSRSNDTCVPSAAPSESESTVGNTWSAPASSSSSRARDAPAFVPSTAVSVCGCGGSSEAGLDSASTEAGYTEPSVQGSDTPPLSRDSLSTLAPPKRESSSYIPGLLDTIFSCGSYADNADSQGVASVQRDTTSSLSCQGTVEAEDADLLNFGWSSKLIQDDRSCDSVSCERCGTLAPLDANFCGMCGQKMVKELKKGRPKLRANENAPLEFQRPRDISSEHEKKSEQKVAGAKSKASAPRARRIQRHTPALRVPAAARSPSPGKDPRDEISSMQRRAQLINMYDADIGSVGPTRSCSTSRPTALRPHMSPDMY